jgi:hypothetical protein
MKRQEAHERNYPLHLVGKTSLSNPTSPEHHALEGTKLHLALRRNYKQPKKPGKKCYRQLENIGSYLGYSATSCIKKSLKGRY